MSEAVARDKTEDDQWVSVVTYLTKSEGERLKSSLMSNGIESIVSPHGPRTRLSVYYVEVKVHQNNLAQAHTIAQAFSRKLAVKAKACPKCGNPKYRVIPKEGWLEKLYYWGATRAQCTRCKTRFVI